ncbi:MAG: TRAP transporter substrate-binding protein DctP [Fretibacterium sp.]|nr:TRAP transporter substrate-binding protein DctP [Fretibacterium sp.]
MQILLLICAAAWAMPAGITPASAGVLIKISHQGPANAETNIQHYFVQEFTARVTEKTKGTVTFEVYPDEQLGSEEQRMELIMKEGLNQPLADIASFAALGTLLPELYPSSIPFMFNSFDAAHIFFDTSEYMAKLKALFHERTGCRLLEVVEEGGFLAFTNSRREIHGPKDFAGLKFRGMDEGQVAIFNAFGASGTPIPWGELYMALKTGVVDGQMNPAFYILLGSLTEVQKYMTLANIQYSDQFLIMNGDLYDSLTDAERAAIVEAAREANELTRERIESQDAGQVEECRRRGMQVYTPTAEEMEQFRTIGQPGYIDWLKKRVRDPQWLEMAQDGAAAANRAAAAKGERPGK